MVPEVAGLGSSGVLGRGKALKWGARGSVNAGRFDVNSDVNTFFDLEMAGLGGPSSSSSSLY